MPDTRSAGIVGKGVTISHAANTAGTAGSYTAFAEITGTVQFPELTMDDVDFTNTASAGNATEKKPDGWINVSDMELELTYVQTQESVLVGLVGVESFFKITLPDTHAWVFNGWVKKLGGDIPNKGRVTKKVAFAISGLPVYT